MSQKPCIFIHNTFLIFHIHTYLFKINKIISILKSLLIKLKNTSYNILYGIENDNDVKYSVAKDALHNNIVENAKLIILCGAGRNGKTYLTNEMRNNLSKNYEIYSPVTYSLILLYGR